MCIALGFLSYYEKMKLRFSGDIEVFCIEYRPENVKKRHFLGDIKVFYIEYRPKNIFSKLSLR